MSIDNHRHQPKLEQENQEKPVTRETALQATTSVQEEPVTLGTPSPAKQVTQATTSVQERPDTHDKPDTQEKPAKEERLTPTKEDLARPENKMMSQAVELVLQDRSLTINGGAIPSQNGFPTDREKIVVHRGDAQRPKNGYTVGYESPKKKKTNKDYSAQVRVFDVDGYKMRADCVCFRDKSRKEVLMVSSRNSEGTWTIPGGGFLPNELAVDAASREALEEAGVVGDIDRYVGSFANSERRTRTEVFTMVVTKEVESWVDKHDSTLNRQRRWFTTEEAMSNLEHRKPLKHRYLVASCMPQISTMDCKKSKRGDFPNTPTPVELTFTSP